MIDLNTQNRVHVDVSDDIRYIIYSNVHSRVRENVYKNVVDNVLYGADNIVRHNVWLNLINHTKRK